MFCYIMSHLNVCYVRFNGPSSGQEEAQIDSIASSTKASDMRLEIGLTGLSGIGFLTRKH